MGVLVIIFVILLLLQITLGVFAWRLKKELEAKYAFPLSDQVEPATVIEKYYEDPETKFQILASEAIPDAAFAEHNLLLVNKNKLYKADLYTNFYIIFQAEMTKGKYSLLRVFSRMLSFTFILSILAIIAGIVAGQANGQILVYIAIGLQLFSIVICLFSLAQVSRLLEDVMIIASGLLHLDDVEIARAHGLKDDLKYSIFEYPFEIVWRIFQFFKP